MRDRNRQFTGDRHYTVVKANTVNVTNVTNVTHVTNVSSPSGWWGGHGKSHRHGGGKGKRRDERPPKLTRFCASCGLLDRNVVAKMDEGEMFGEAAKVCGYAARNLARETKEIVCGLAGCAVDFTRGAFKLIGAFIP